MDNIGISEQDMRELHRKHLGEHRLTPCQWWIVPPLAKWAGVQEVTLDAMPQIDDTLLYAIRKRGLCLAKNGEWEYEPMPSSRNKSFMKRCRFASPELAMKAWEKCVAKGHHPEKINGQPTAPNQTSEPS